MTSRARKTKLPQSQHAIHVSVRIRPDAGDVVTVSDAGNLSCGSGNFTYASSVVRGSDQEAAFDALASRLLSRLSEGYSCTLLAYGQTGSGKTHTMFGPPGCLTEASLRSEEGQRKWGILPRALSRLVQRQGTEVHVSAVEVYQGLAYDLLAERAPLKVGSKGGNQRTGMGATSVVTAGKTAVGGTHPAGCRCRKCLQAKADEEHMRRIRIAVAKGGVDELFRTLAGKPGMDPFKLKKMMARAEKELKAGGGVGKRRRRKKAADDAGFATVGEKLIKVKDMEEVMRLARTVELSRTTVGHALNERSSRSHCLVHIHVVERTTKSRGRSRSGGKKGSGGGAGAGAAVQKKQLLLVDLAGSERIEKSQVKGVAREQAIQINSSLTALGRVIEALGKRQARRGRGSGTAAAGNGHVPFRDSTLTMLLRSSFGGRSCTSVVINVADNPAAADETLRSLQFGERLAIVKNAATIVLATDVQEAKTSLAAALAAAEAELAQLAQRGEAGGASPVASAAQAAEFRKQDRRLEELVAKTRALEVRIREESGGGGGGGGKGIKSGSRRDELRRCRAEAATLRQNIERSKKAVDRLSGMALWKPPSSKYAAKARDVAELQGRLQLLGGGTR